jgi:hypothetical protein
MSLKPNNIGQTIMADVTSTVTLPTAAAKTPVFTAPSVGSIPADFRGAYAALGTSRLVRTGACTVTGPQTIEGTEEYKIFNGKVKVWFTAIGQLRDEESFVDYQTKKPIEAPGAMEVFLTPSQLQGMQKVLSEGYSDGIIIQARAGDVAAYDVPATAAINAICSSMGIKQDELPFSLLIERPESALSYEDARNRRQAGQLLESGRLHYATDSQLGVMGNVGAARQAMSSLLKG